MFIIYSTKSYVILKIYELYEKYLIFNFYVCFVYEYNLFLSWQNWNGKNRSLFLYGYLKSSTVKNAFSLVKISDTAPFFILQLKINKKQISHLQGYHLNNRYLSI